MASNVNILFSLPCASGCAVYRPFRVKKKQKQNHQRTCVALSVSCSEPCQRKMQQQRALEALPCIAPTPMRTHTFHICRMHALSFPYLWYTESLQNISVISCNFTTSITLFSYWMQVHFPWKWMRQRSVLLVLCFEKEMVMFYDLRGLHCSFLFREQQTWFNAYKARNISLQ